MTLSRTALSAAATALAFALSGAPTAAAATLELNCTYEESAVTDGVATEITCDNQLYAHSESLIEPNSPEFWGYISICIGLVIGAGMMSGLTIGLVSLDANSLKVLTRSGTPAEKRRAARILPLVQRHHLLLVTLLLSNAICMEALPIFLDRLAPAVIAIVISVTAVLLFGEIIPQALCTRFGLAIGANLAYVVWFLIIVSFPISWPISKLLDYLFGHSHSTYFGREQLTELVQLHEMHEDSNKEPLTTDEVQLIRGTLALSSKKVADYLTPIEKVFALEQNVMLDALQLERLREYGHSRIPVYNGTLENITGVLLVKSLLGIANSTAPMRVRDFKLQSVVLLSPAYGLYDALHTFQTGRSHLAVVQETNDDGDVRTLGIITMEDILEELFLTEIQDETDLDKLRRPARSSLSTGSLAVDMAGTSNGDDSTTSLTGSGRAQDKGNTGILSTQSPMRPSLVLGFKRSISMGQGASSPEA